MKPNQIKKILLWLICLSVLRGVAYIVITPPWQAPDETTHFQFIELLTERPLSEIRSIPLHGGDNRYFELEHRILESMKKYKAWEYVGLPTPNPLPDCFYHAPFFVGSAPKIYRPFLYYLVGAEFLKILNPKDLETRLYVVRFYSLILSLGTVIFSGLLGYLVFKDETYAFMTGSFVSFLPQFMVIGTSVNADNLTNFLTSLFLLYAVFLLSKKKGEFYLLFIPIFLCAFFLSSKTTAAIAPIGLLLFALQVGKSRSFLRVLTVSLLILASFTLLVYYLLPGMIGATRSTVEWFSASLFSGVERGSGFYNLFLRILFKSFWFVGGWMQIYWDDWLYVGLAILCLLSSLGLLQILWDRVTQKGEVFFPHYSILLLILTTLLIFGATLFYYGFTRGVLAQGRYLFPALPAFGVLFILGLRRIWPPSMLSHIPTAFLIFFVSIDLYALLGAMLPYFHLK